MTIAVKIKPFPSYQVTYAAFNKIKFYLDLSSVVAREINYLENVAVLTISKLKASSQIPQGIIKDIIYDVNEVDRVIYFDIVLYPFSAESAFIELVSYLTNNMLIV